MGSMSGSEREFFAQLFTSLRYVKPICYELRLGDSFDWSCGHLTLTVDRTAPLVPVRKSSSTFLGNAYLRIKRIFTKERLHYYFGLGSADCARSYHLTVAGPAKTFLSRFTIVRVGGLGEFFICKDIRVSSRYSQKLMRLYIRHGRGFSHAALDVSFEMLSQRPIATAVITAVAVLLTVAYLFAMIVLRHDCKIDVFKPVSVLSIGTLFSIWQAMDEYRAEEWLWSCVVAVSLSSLTVIIMSMLEALGFMTDRPVKVLIWTLCLTATLASAVAASSVFFSKIKLHGAIMDRVPKIRRVARHDKNSKDGIDFAKLIEVQMDMLRSAGETEDTFHFSDRAQRAEEDFAKGSLRGVLNGLNRQTMYIMGIRQYRCLISAEWPDGWLMPVWVSSMNPFRLPSKQYCEDASRAL